FPPLCSSSQVRPLHLKMKIPTQSLEETDSLKVHQLVQVVLVFPLVLLLQRTTKFVIRFTNELNRITDEERAEDEALSFFSGFAGSLSDSLLFSLSDSDFDSDAEEDSWEEERED